MLTATGQRDPAGEFREDPPPALPRTAGVRIREADFPCWDRSIRQGTGRGIQRLGVRWLDAEASSEASAQNAYRAGSQILR